MTYKCRQWWYNVNNTIRNFFRLYDAVDAIYGITVFLFARYHLTNIFSKDSKILNFV